MDDPVTSDAPDAPVVIDVPETTEPADTGDDATTGPDETTVESTVVVPERPGISASVRDSGIPIGTVVLAGLVFIAVVLVVLSLARRRSSTGTRRAEPRRVVPPPPTRGPDDASSTAAPSVEGTGTDTVTLQFLLELGHALIDAGDAVNHVESTVRTVAQINGLDGVGVLVLPSALVLSVQRGQTISTEVRTSDAAALRLDQIDDVFRLVRDAEEGTITPAEGRRRILRIRSGERPESWALLLVAYAISTVGLSLLLRAGWHEIVLATALGVLIGGLTIAARSLDPSYQALWPLLAAGIVSTAAFGSARLIDHLTVFPVLVAPLIVFLPGGLLTIGVLELSTGQPVSGSSRLAAGGMRLVLLALGILAGANLIGVPGGAIRSGTAGVVSELAPWLGVGLFGVGIAWYNGARRSAQGWILLVLYLAYSAQVLGGLLFGSTLSAFFGALAMTPAALLASRQRTGPTPLVTFLPGFWLLVPGALGLEGVTLILGDGSSHGSDIVGTALISMIGISCGILLGLLVSGADASRPWSGGRRSGRRRGHDVGEPGQIGDVEHPVDVA